MPHATTKVKNAYHEIDWEERLADAEEHTGLDFANGRWGDRHRTFDCRLLQAGYDSQGVRGDVTVNVKEGADPVTGLLVGFAIAYYFHPSDATPHW